MALYEDGSAFCFSCKENFTKRQVDAAGTIEVKPRVRDDDDDFAPVAKKLTVEEVKTFQMRGFRERGIPRDIAEFFEVRVSFDTKGDIDTHYYPYGDNAYNVRKVHDKDFFQVGSQERLFGQDKFNGGGKRLIITEGEPDAMAVAYASRKTWNKIYPVVTMGSSANLKLIAMNREWIRSFGEVILWFDNDEPGREAAEKATKMIGYDKVKLAKHQTFKDANETLLRSTEVPGIKAITQVIFDAMPATPGGILTRAVLKERMRLLNSVSALPYPACMEGVNSKLKGMRFGEITLLTSGTGSGKSTLLREIVLEIKRAAAPEDKIGICALEESPEAEARRLSGMQLSRNTAKEEMAFEELERGFDELFGTDDEPERIMMLDHQGSMNDTSIIDKIEYMCLMGCKYIIIDHITILVSEGVEKLQGNEAQDKIMNDLLSIVKRYPVWIGLVSHLRKVGSGAVSFEEGKLPTLDDIKGSGSIKQICFDIIAFARNLNAKEEKARNTIKMAVLKARTTGLTGRVTGAIYDHDTGRLHAADVDSMDDEEESFGPVESTWAKK